MQKLIVFLIVLAAVGAGVYYFYPEVLGGPPGDRAARSAVEKLVSDQSSVLGIDLFQKTDGQERTDTEGVTRYRYDYKCVAKFRKEAMWKYVGGRFMTADPLPEKASRKEKKEAEERLAGMERAAKGATVALKGTVQFEKKESGWVVSSATMQLDR